MFNEINFIFCLEFSLCCGNWISDSISNFYKTFKGPLFFGTTIDFESLAKQIPKNATTVIIRMGRMPYMDQSGLYVMEDVLIDLVNEGKMVLLVNILNQPKYMMEQIDIMPDLMPKERMFIDFNASMVWIKAN